MTLFAYALAYAFIIFSDEHTLYRNGVVYRHNIVNITTPQILSFLYLYKKRLKTNLIILKVAANGYGVVLWYFSEYIMNMIVDTKKIKTHVYCINFRFLKWTKQFSSKIALHIAMVPCKVVTKRKPSVVLDPSWM